MRTFKLLLVLLIFAVPAMADSIWDVSGVITLVGNNACGGPPCVETLAFSFDVDYQPSVTFPGTFLPEMLDAKVTSFGPLAPFQLNGLVYQGYVPFGNAPGDEIDLLYGNGSLDQTEVPGPPQLIRAEVYSCPPTLDQLIPSV